MNRKYVLGLLLTTFLLLSIMPAMAFWHPPDEDPEKPPTPCFYVTLNGEGSDDIDDKKILVARGNGSYCNDITIEVFVHNVVDLYSYEFKLEWDEIFFKLTAWEVVDIFGGHFYQVKPEDDYDGSEPYHQAVSAIAPAEGVNGTHKVAILTFHIETEPCWFCTCYEVEFEFAITYKKMGDICGEEIPDICNYDLYGLFKAVQPGVLFDPENETCWEVERTFVKHIWVIDVVKLKSFYADIIYNSDLLEVVDVVINEEVIPKPWIGGEPGWVDYDGNLVIDVENDCTSPAFNGTGVVASITFEQLDPWPCGSQPWYDKEDHEWFCETPECDIYFYYGELDAYCCVGKIIIAFGVTSGVPEDNTSVNYAYYNHNDYMFAPIPGDLDGSGHVDEADLGIIAFYYGAHWCAGHAQWEEADSHVAFDPTLEPWEYDLNGDDIIDIIDVSIVGKHFCMTEPPYL